MTWFVQPNGLWRWADIQQSDSLEAMKSTIADISARDGEGMQVVSSDGHMLDAALVNAGKEIHAFQIWIIPKVYVAPNAELGEHICLIADIWDVIEDAFSSRKMDSTRQRAELLKPYSTGLSTSLKGWEDGLVPRLYDEAEVPVVMRAVIRLEVVVIVRLPILLLAVGAHHHSDDPLRVRHKLPDHGANLG